MTNYDKNYLTDAALSLLSLATVITIMIGIMLLILPGCVASNDLSHADLFQSEQSWND